MSSADPPRRAAYFADNRANWDDRAALHEASGYGIEALLASPTAITAEIAPDRKRLGDLSGLDVVHLQCHLGLDTVSLARLGARRVVGLDLSGGSLRRARSIAARAGADIEFVRANVYDARQALVGDFDLVYTSLGVLCWLPDVAAWARVVVSLLRPGGRLVLRDDHPLFQAVGDDVSRGLMLHEPYFQCADPMTWEDAGSYVAAADGAPAITHTVSHQWNHGVGEILTALLAAGLVLDEVTETRYSAWCRWPELMERCAEGFRFADPALRDRLPLQLAVVAHLPEQVGGQ
ncbi:class I SAM-dependent methyltransferase [Actinomyces qiguomingii]|uniref:class I SAM-dependent methyltransferase n=1 Tax=Actinomyces qiguomingii TaxID=2057800 RepID=UPI000CA01219|nr:class I SAM-dependent methyltransferase [Actinomyces qiguomingii]